MISEEEIQGFNIYLKKNHLFESNLKGIFNPSFLLLNTERYDSKFLNGLVFQHEFAHARLTACFYGQLIFCLKIIEIEFYSFLVRKNASVNYTNKRLVQITNALSHLIKNWINCQEGFAMHCNYYTLEKQKTNEAKIVEEKNLMN